MNIMDLAEAIAPEANIEIIGIRPGEKFHEVMISSDDAINTLEFTNHFVIQPAQPRWDTIKYIKINGGKNVEEGFTFDSSNNADWLSIDDLANIISHDTISDAIVNKLL